MADVFYTATTLPPVGKKGILTPDEQGYYQVVLGALNVYNTSGELYVLDGAKKLFDESSTFIRRVNNGDIYAEAGHPVPLPGQSFESFATRVLTIQENNICAHIKKVWLDYSSIKDESGRPVVTIMGLVKPFGDKGKLVLDSLTNQNTNTAFSLRSFTADKMVGGVNHRTIDTVITFDFVVTPGIKYARKFFSPALESHDVMRTGFSKENLMSILRGETLPQGYNQLAFENAKNICREVISGILERQKNSLSFTAW